MNGYYSIVSEIRDYIKSLGLVNTVTIGDIYDVDLDKQTMYPLTHIISNNAQLTQSQIILNLSILFMDIVDESKEQRLNVFDGNDNELDVLNTQLAIANRFTNEVLRGDYFNNYDIIGTPTAEPFVDRFENKIAGWTLTFDIAVPNDMTVCD
jgi:hypothetical protein